ncbi:Asp23/Gls24 family envelope stress response protein [Candidatus Acetothermia bacterium]|nr:Asp23/Gls24 family envelope stress response protein [Candidatus Acetothermia bacterium]MBI3643488.1 Asp23/Gls24 family envelope stress response protein [Candidatus Acetothermia bacterium]
MADKRDGTGHYEARDELGHIFISERALQMIVYGALLEVDGLYALNRVKGGNLLKTISKNYQGTGIQILKVAAQAESRKGMPKDQQRDQAKIMKVKLSLAARFGANIHDVSEMAVQKVRTKVKELAGLDIDDVEIEITGIATV